MSHLDSAPSVDYPAAVESLTRHILDSLQGMRKSTGLADHVAQATDVKAALAAVRVLGPDVFAPAVLASASFGTDDREVVAEALRVFPPAPEDTPETACLGQAMAGLLARFGGESTVVPGVPESRCVPVGSAGGLPAARGAAVTTVTTVAADGDWRAWTRSMARLAPLALPGVAGPAHEQARTRTLALNRGVVRSMLRRDYPTAARLVRWAALAHDHDGDGDRDRAADHDRPSSLDITSVVTHLELFGAGGTRASLNTGIARLLVTGQQKPKGLAS